MTNHELNVKAAEAVGRIWKGAILHMRPEFVYYVVEAEDEDGEVEFIDWCFSPATSIEDAMDLLPLLPIPWWIEIGADSHDVRVALYCGEEGSPREQESWPYNKLPRAITKAFVAATEAAK